MIFDTFIDVLNYWVDRSPDKPVFSFTQEIGDEPVVLTFSQFQRRVLSIANQLASVTRNGDRVLLLYTPGLEFISAFFACLSLGVIAVPAYPPISSRKQQNVMRLNKIIQNCTPKLMLCDQKVKGQLARILSGIQPTQVSRSDESLTLQSLPFFSTEEWVEPDVHSQDVRVDACDIAFLQYTSGSTGDPKGVMVSHGNLIDNSNQLRRSFDYNESTVGVSWLPQYHDMGLIGSILQPLYGGWLMHMFPPAQFVRNPLRWLRQISKVRAAISGAPNFAFDYCCERLKPEDMEDIDLSCWKVAYCGAEPIRNSSVRGFNEAFAKYGYSENTFYPVFGMAEHTLICTAGAVGEAYESVALNVEKLVSCNEVDLAGSGAELVKEFVACGQELPGHQLRIVHPQSFDELGAGKVGEIWSCGPSVAQGYWGQEELTKSIFAAYTSQGQGPFFRTGDLGYLLEGKLYITGRLKDLIIIRGCNYAPQDIENTVECSHEALRSSSAAAFSCDIGGVEQLVVVCELERSWLRKQHDEVIKAIVQAVSQKDRVEVSRIILVKPGAAFKTTSGKIQRRKTKSVFLESAIKGVSNWSRDSVSRQQLQDQDTQELISVEEFYVKCQDLTNLNDKQDYLLRMMRQQLSVFLNLPQSSIDLQVNLFDLGLDSLGLVSVVNQIQAFFPVSADINLFDVLMDEQDRTVENGMSLSYLSFLLGRYLFGPISDKCQSEEAESIV